MASSSSHQWNYDVFLSFRGKDTRKGFTDHLYAALCRKGIETFMDNQLKRGKQISPTLLAAIENSRFSIIVLSQNYASSSWCLDELAKILDCAKIMGHEALPVFYDVDPSHVKKREGSYAEAFAKHEQIYMDNMEKVVKWKAALTEVATISGWDSRDWHEAKLIEDIVENIWNKLDHLTTSTYMNGLVGMDSRIKKINDLLCIPSRDVRMVGIWGMAGIGKTTIAKAIYQRIYTLFEGCCFLSNVREESRTLGLSHLKKEIVSQICKEGNPQKFNAGIRLHTKKVLLILDDVDQQEQLEFLVGNRDRFGPGSRIIITTRDRHLLTYPEVNDKYEAKELNNDEALELFCLQAFRLKDGPEDFSSLCRQALDYTKGLPLALKVLGSSLYTKSQSEWESELAKLRQFPNQKVQNVLRTNVEGLDENDLRVFLDIAFFFKGDDKDFVGEMLESSGISFSIGIRNLVDKSLITILENRLWMHDLLQEMGWEIVKQESKVPGGRSRLRVHEDINHVLTKNTVTEAVEGIFLKLNAPEELKFSVEVFEKMKKLRYFMICNLQIDRSLEYLSKKEYMMALSHDPWASLKYDRMERENECGLHPYGDVKYLSNELRSLYWHGCHLRSLPSNFHPEKLVELNMCFSQLKQLWEGNKTFEKLKFIKLSHSRRLTKTPDFSGAPNLERLILEGCKRLKEIHPSIGVHKKLIFLNLGGCKKLRSFTSSIHMESLQILTFSGCLKLNKCPEVQGNMEHLQELSLEGTAIKGLPSSIENLTGVTLLTLENCGSLESLPSSIFKLKSLKTLKLSNCSRLKKLPEMLEKMENLMEVSLDGSGLQELPSSIGCLKGLVLLNLTNCKKLASLPQSICELTSLQRFYLCGCSDLKELPDELGNLLSLEELKLDGSGIEGVPPSINLLTNHHELSLPGCKGGESKQRNLSVVYSMFSSPTIPRLPSSSLLSVTTKLSLSDCQLLEGVLPSATGTTEILLLRNCMNLLPALPVSIRLLIANNYTSLETFFCPQGTHTGKKHMEFRLEFCNCKRLMENEDDDRVRHIPQGIQEGIQFLASRPEIQYSDDTVYFLSKWATRFHVVAPGSSIPDWFADQSMGCSVKVELPSHWLNTEFLGIAVCAAVGVKGAINPSSSHPFIYFYFDDDSSKSVTLWKWDCLIESDHMWFGYVSLHYLLRVYGDGFDRPGGIMVGSFRIEDGNEKLEVTKCGVRLVYKGEETHTYCRFPHGAMLPKNWKRNQNSGSTEACSIL